MKRFVGLLTEEQKKAFRRRDAEAHAADEESPRGGHRAATAQEAELKLAEIAAQKEIKHQEEEKSRQEREELKRREEEKLAKMLADPAVNKNHPSRSESRPENKDAPTRPRSSYRR